MGDKKRMRKHSRRQTEELKKAGCGDIDAPSKEATNTSTATHKPRVHQLLGSVQDPDRKVKLAEFWCLVSRTFTEEENLFAAMLNLTQAVHFKEVPIPSISALLSPRSQAQV